MSNRSSASRKARRGSKHLPRNAGAWMLFTDCPGCSLCDLLAGTGESVVTIHQLETGTEQSVGQEKSERPHRQVGPLQINTPAATGADQRVQRNG
jgi:hypothetical protein